MKKLLHVILDDMKHYIHKINGEKTKQIRTIPKSKSIRQRRTKYDVYKKFFKIRFITETKVAHVSKLIRKDTQ